MRYIYLDVVVAVNIIMSAVILALTSWLAQIPLRISRVLLGAVAGTAFTVLLIASPSGSAASWAPKLLISLLMVITAFAPVPLERFCRVLGYFYLISFGLGGSVLAVYYLAHDPVLAVSQGYWPKLSWWMLGAGSVVIVVASRLAWLYLKKRRWQEEFTAELTVRYMGKEDTVPGMVDSGNLLVDPLTGAPVIIVEAAALSRLLPRSVVDLVAGGQRGHLDVERLDQCIGNDVHRERFRVIPFETLSHENSLLLGFRPDKVRVKYRNQDISLPRAIVGLAPGRLSAEGAWQALIGPEVLLSYLEGV